MCWDHSDRKEDMKEIYDIVVARLETLKDKGDAITLYDLSGILDEITKRLGGDAPELDLILRNEIVKIAEHIEITKKELGSLVPEQVSNKNISQLEAVIRGTEEAASAILDAADEIQKVISASEAPQETKDKIVEVTTRIYEACNFQDLTGQRIIKVMRELEFVEAKIRYLVQLFTGDGTADASMPDRLKGTRPDRHLMEGPQLPGSGPSQAEIDAMLKNM